ncbi:hypothetical protein EVAR_16777_1 [Eumeta japonica]|uniref:Uncharacterized protein n=1 Tax=Eumeta variegata TaxID=151549 RepID=A0A4C1UM99_EUMVA|nr:hypothetical protein EVAR_16777_1 [Eumeta japonica]
MHTLRLKSGPSLTCHWFSLPLNDGSSNGIVRRGHTNGDIRPPNGQELGDLRVRPRSTFMQKRRRQTKRISQATSSDVSIEFEKIVTPSLNSIPDDISTTDEIDSAIGRAPTNHIRIVVEKSGREIPAFSDRRRLPANILELIRAKNARTHTPLQIQNYIAHTQHIKEEVQNKAFLERKDDLPPVSLSEVQTLVKSLKTKKASDLDCISRDLSAHLLPSAYAAAFGESSIQLAGRWWLNNGLSIATLWRSHNRDSDELRDDRPSTVVNNKNIDAVHRMIKTDRRVT